jgi:PadR family transcriptional regulator, regulatory protein PadR
VRLFCRRTPGALQGTLDLLVLKVLSRGPHHGCGIAADIEAIFGDVLRVEEGTLYPPLHRMEHLGWIGAACQMTANKRRAPVYRVTRAGEKQLAEIEKWARLTEGVAKVLRFA